MHTIRILSSLLQNILKVYPPPGLLSLFEGNPNKAIDNVGLAHLQDLLVNNTFSFVVVAVGV